MIHKTAIVEDGANIGSDVSVGACAFIEAGATIGDGCVVGPGAVITRYATLGALCKIHSGAVIGDLPQDLGFNGGESHVIIGSKCVLREGVTIHRGTKAGTVTRLGDGCFLMANSHLAHNVTLGNNVIMANGALVGGYVEVGDRVFISANCVLHQFTRVGRVAMMGGLSGISKDVPPFCTTKPITPNKVMGLNVVGMRRAGLTPQERSEVKEAFVLLYRSGLNVTQALEKMQALFKDGPAAEFTAFVQSSKRGVCGWSGNKEEESLE